MNLIGKLKKIFVAAVTAIMVCGNLSAAVIDTYDGLVDAIGAAEEGATLKLKAGSIVVAAPLTVAKGIVLSGGWTDDATRADKATTTLDGADSTSVESVVKFSNASGTAQLDRIVVTRGYRHGLAKTGNGDLVLSDSSFLANGLTSASGPGEHASDGRGLNLTGAGATVYARNCVFAGNGQVNTDKYQTFGGAVYAKTLKRFVVDGSSFVTNGHDYVSAPADANIWGFHGAAIYAEDAPVTIRGSRFAANSSITWRDRGATVYLGGNSGGSAFTNCVFVGNQSRENGGSVGLDYRSAAIELNLSSSSALVEIDNCTIAYNLNRSDSGSSGIGVTKGRVKVRNSIIYGNWHSVSTALCGADLSVAANGSADVAFSWLTENSVSCWSGTDVTFGPGMRFGDPELRMSLASAQQYLTTGTTRTFKADQATVTALATMDVREATDSPAIDAGDPDSAYDREPAGHNGSRVNLGAYGNTPEAAPSDPVAATIAATEISFPNQQTRPKVTITLGAASAAYDAIVTVYGSVDGDSTSHTDVVYGVHPGETVTVSPSVYFTAGQTYRINVVAQVAGCVDAVADNSAVVTGERPIWIGHGGGANVIHVREGADGAATGKNWTDAFPDLASALLAVQGEKNEIWIAGRVTVDVTPRTFSPAYSVTIRGGFTSAEDSPEERTDGVFSTLDGCDDTDTPQLIDMNNAAGNTITFERLVLTRGYWRAIKKTGAGDLVLSNCRVVDNGRTAVPASSSFAAGCGIHVTGGSGTTVSVSDCVFSGNCLTNAFNYSCMGGAIYASTLKELVLERLRFEGNGVYLPSVGKACVWGFTGAAVYATGAPVTARSCQFVANHAISWNAHGGTVYLGGASGGSSFDHCIFAGNESVVGDGGIAGGRNSALVLNLSSATAAVGVKNCTFAYNMSWAKIPAAGIGVVKGALSVRNSIFYGNRYTVDETATGVDISVSENGSADVAYSLLSANDSSSYAGFTPGVGVIYGDPKFVTDKATIDALVTGTGKTRTYVKTEATQTALTAIDVHLKSKKGYFTNAGAKVTDGSVDSPALDAGNPDDDFTNETEPNGNCINLGAYGNTSEASNSEVTAPAIESVEVSYLGEYTQPTVSVKVGAEGGGEGSFLARVTIDVADAAGKTTSEVVGGVECGQTVTSLVRSYYQPGSKITVSVTVSVAGFADLVDEAAHTVDESKSLPPWYGKGGPANVVHLWAGAQGKADGSCWADAFTDIKSAQAALAADGKDELWIAGVVTATDEQGVLVPVCPLTVRGGFTALENTAAERPADLSSTLTGADVIECVLQIDNPTDTPVTFERMRFVDGKYRGLKTSGAGDVTFVGCAIEGNGKGQRSDSASDHGFGARFTGSGSTVTLSNCVVAGNVQTTGDRNQQRGGGVYADAIKKLVLDDVVFVTNGVPHSLAQGAVAAWGFVGSALYAYNTPVEARGCRFIGNNGVTHRTYGSSVFLNGTCGESAFVNCAFVGNQTTRYGAPYDPMSDYAAAFSMNLSSVDATVDLKNCTIAYNIGASYMGSAGIGVVKGTVRVRDSIIFGNVHSEDGKAGGADISISANGRADVAYTLLTANDGSSWTGEGVTLGEGMVYGNPLLVTTPEDAVGCMTATAPRYYKTDAAEALSKFNVHLRGRHGYVDEKTGELVKFVGAKSPALDAGDPASVYANEPSPNGHRVNLGYYGNTPWATLSPGGLVIILK